MAQSTAQLRREARFRHLVRPRRGGDHRARLGLETKGPTKLVTDLGVFEPDPQTKEMTVTSIHPGVTREQITDNTGWPVRYAGECRGDPAPTAE